MGQILIRNIDDDVHQRLKAKAAERGQSLEAYVRALLREDAKPGKAALLAQAAAIRARAGRATIPPEEMIRQMRDERDEQLWQAIKPKADR